MWIDGGAEGSGVCRINSTYALFKDNELVEQAIFHPGIGTSNQAEFIALIHGLARLRELGIHGCKIFSDSKLTVEWALGRWNVNKVDGCVLWKPKVQAALSELGVRLQWKSRVGNKAHDVVENWSIL